MQILRKYRKLDRDSKESSEKAVRAGEITSGCVRAWRWLSTEWLGKARREVGALKLDFIVPDCTMSKMTHRAAMSKLARFQAVSHGHQ